MNSMLMLYMIPIPSTKGIELMTIEKDRRRTWPEHYQLLVYVAKRSGNSEQSVLEYLCKSASAHILIAMLTRLNYQRADYLVQAAELAEFAIDIEVSTSKQRNEGGRAERSRNGQGGRYSSDGRMDQDGREDLTSQELGSPTLENVAPRKRVVPDRHLEESQWPLVPVLVLALFCGF